MSLQCILPRTHTCTDTHMHTHAQTNTLHAYNAYTTFLDLLSRSLVWFVTLHSAPHIHSLGQGGG